MAAFGGPAGPPLGPPPGPPPLIGPAIPPPPGGIIYNPAGQLPPPPALSNHLIPVRQELAQLRAGLALQSRNWEGFKDSLHQAIHAVLTAAIARGNGTIRIPQTDIPIIAGEIRAAVAQVTNPNSTNPAERGRVLTNLNNFAPHLSIDGGWTPKPKRTKRVNKKRKSRVK
jgi:hypothetical protein